MLSASEMVIDTSGIMKPLQDFIKSAGSGGVGPWTSTDPAAIANNTDTNFPDEISAALGEQDDVFTDIIITFVDETAKVVTTYCDTWHNFKTYFSQSGYNIDYWEKAGGTGSGSSNINVFQSQGKSDGKYKYKVVLNSLFAQNTHKIIFSVR